MLCLTAAIDDKQVCVAPIETNRLVSAVLAWAQDCVELRIGGLNSEKKHLTWFKGEVNVGQKVSFNLTYTENENAPLPTNDDAARELSLKERIASQNWQTVPVSQEIDVVCFKVSVNNRQLYVAGVGKTGVLSVALHSFGHNATGGVGGIVDRDEDYFEHVNWKPLILGVNDNLVVHVVESQLYDLPIERRERFMGCGFCGRRKPDSALTGGWGASICQDCVQSYAKAFAEPAQSLDMATDARCSFCTKTSQGHPIIQGQKGGFICEGCVQKLLDRPPHKPGSNEA